MSRKRIVIFLFLAVLAVLLWWWFSSPKTAPTLVQQKSSTAATPSSVSAAPKLAKPGAPVINLPDTNQQKAWFAAFRTPISFWGKVVDEKGNPVPDASVKLGANDNPSFSGEGSDYERKTDANGLFSITGIHGIALSVWVSKKGYYITKQSSGSAHYVVKGKSDIPVPTSDNPSIFVLQKMGVTEPMIQVSSRQIDVPKTGQPLSIDLTTGQTGRGNLQLESWMGEKGQKNRHYDWRYQLSVPGGGLIERKGQFDFEAPADGYQATAEINMPTTAERWSSRTEKQYFAKLADGRYARFSIRFYSGALNAYPEERNMVVIESYLNPKPGSRNLEFDPNQPVAAGN